MIIPTPTLVLRNGARMGVDGSVQSENGRVLFRSAGALYSLPQEEVDLEATRAAGLVVVARPEADRGRLKVSAEERARLLRELEQNHRGQTAADLNTRLDLPRSITDQPSPSEKGNSEEWMWRRRAREHEETIRQARENLELLTSQVEKLRGEIRSLLFMGYKPNQFTYQSTQLEYAIAQIPQAELQVTRAQRDYDQFRDDARRLGVLPGWLR